MNNKDHMKNLKPFVKGDPRINRKGQPKKNYPQLIAEVKKMGYVAPARQEYFEMIGLLLVMSEDDLKQYATDKTRPYWIRLIVIDLNNKQTRQRLMADYRDWLFGQAEQTINQNSIIEHKLGKDERKAVHKYIAKKFRSKA